MISAYFHTNVSREGSKLTDHILDDKTDHAEKEKINTLVANRL